MKILFVNPPNTTSLGFTEKGKYVTENIGNQFFLLPRIPFEVTAILNKSNINTDINLLDYEWYKNPNLSNENIIEIIVDKKPDIILTTLISQASADTIDWLTTKLKEKLSNCIIIVGGQAILHLKDKIFKFCPNVDFAYIGDANGNLTKLLQNLINKKEISGIEGLIFKQNKIIKVNEIKNNLELMNYISEELYDKHKNLILEVVKSCKQNNMYVLGLMESFKGCPFMCSFCAAKGKIRERDIDKCLKEIEYLYNLGIYRFYFMDLTFGVNRFKTEELLQKLSKFKEINPNFEFRCVTRVDIINEKFVKSLENAGCYEIGLGVECNDSSVLNLMSKHITENKTSEALKILGESKISFKLFLIEGYKGSSSKSSKKTFELLNILESKGYNYFIQPALSRDIIPSFDGFKIREQKGILKRGTMHQLDFRNDCRHYGWDTNRTIRVMCLLILAYPSTELGKEYKDIELQKRIPLDLPFAKDNIKFDTLVQFIKKLENKDTLPLKLDLIHYLDGILTIEEIEDRLFRLYNKKLTKSTIRKEIDYCIKELRDVGLIDSFGNPNLKDNIKLDNKTEFNNINYLEIDEKSLLFWNGKDQRYLYAPLKKEVIDIKTCLFKNIPEEVFEFFIFAKGKYPIGEISERLYKIFKDKEGFSNLNESKETTEKIYLSCKNYGLCN